MNATSQLRKISIVPSSRPVIETPGLQVVPTPGHPRGFIGTVMVCALIFLGALTAAFYLNTLMVSGAYQLKDIAVEQNEVNARRATLTSEVIELSSPTQLQAAAHKLGMVPAKTVLFLDVDSKTVVSPAERTD